MANVYEMVTARIIEELEKGIIPWQKPWTGTPNGAFSRSTGKPYSFINQLLLGKPGEYLTFKQIQEAGGHFPRYADFIWEYCARDNVDIFILSTLYARLLLSVSYSSTVIFAKKEFH